MRSYYIYVYIHYYNITTTIIIDDNDDDNDENEGHQQNSLSFKHFKHISGRPSVVSTDNFFFKFSICLFLVIQTNNDRERGREREICKK